MLHFFEYFSIWFFSPFFFPFLIIPPPSGVSCFFLFFPFSTFFFFFSSPAHLPAAFLFFIFYFFVFPFFPIFAIFFLPPPHPSFFPECIRKIQPIPTWFFRKKTPKVAERVCAIQDTELGTWGLLGRWGLCMKMGLSIYVEMGVQFNSSLVLKHFISLKPSIHD